MTPEPPNDASPDTQKAHRHWPWRTIAIAALILILALIAPATTFSKVESQMDAVTGSVSLKTVWLFLITFSPQVNASPLEARLRSSGISWTPSWQSVHTTHRNVFGGTIKNEWGTAPPIDQLEAQLDQFTAASSDAELKEFVQTMQSGTIAQQRAAIDAASDKGLRASSAIHRGE